MRAVRLLALLLSALLVAVVASIAVPAANAVAGVLALASGVVGFWVIRGPVRIVIAALVVVGIAGIVAGALLGNPPGFAALGSLNQDLIAMLASVSFVRLVIPTAEPSDRGLRGWPAVVRTTLAVHALGSVINMSAVTLAAHRLAGGGRLPLADGVLLSRAYATGAFWSPFWLASAAAIAYLPGADVPFAMLCGAAVAVVALLIGCFDVGRALGDRRRTYRGYSLTPALLVVPVAMVVLVLVGHLLLPHTPIPRLVTASALLVTFVGLLLRRDLARMARHAASEISSVRSEAGLFVAAGILTIGLAAVVGAVGPVIPLARYDVAVAWICLLITVALALLGLHPIVTLALVGAVVLPADPEPTLFLVATLLGWGAATTVGVTSGLLMHLTSQFGIDLRAIVTRNLTFVAIVAAVAWPALLAVEAWAPR